MGIKSALFWFVLVLALMGIWKLLDLPPESEMIEIVSVWIGQYGLLIIFTGAFLESLLFIGLYFPGSLIIFLGVGLSSDGYEATLSVIGVSLGMLCGYTINYLVGWHGWHKLFLKLGMKEGLERAQYKMQQSDIRYIFYTFWNPGLAAFTATAAGLLQYPIKRFFNFSTAAIIVWNAFWGVLVYSLGKDALVLLDFTVVLKVIGVWVLLEIGLVLHRKFIPNRNSL